MAPLAQPEVVASADFLDRYARTYRFRLGMPEAMQLTPEGTLLFLRSPADGFVRDLYELDPDKGEERVVLTAMKLLLGDEEDLPPEELARRERTRSAARGIASFQLSKDGKQVLVPLSGDLFVLDRATGETRRVGTASGYPIDPRFDPTGTRVALVRNGDLHVIDLTSGEETKLTSRSGPDQTWGLAEFVAQEEMSRMRGFWWSPDGKRLAVQVTDTRGLETMHIADPMHPEEPPQTWPYPRAGKQNADVRLAIISATAPGEPTWVEWDRERFEYLAAVTWPAATGDEPGGPLTVVLEDRLQRLLEVREVDPADGKTRPLHAERSDAWLNLHPGMPRWLAGGQRWLWITEREGFPQLELHDRTGALVRPLTEESLGLRGFVDVGPKGEWVLVEASADPTETHVWRVPMDDGGKPERLTVLPKARHSAVAGSRSGRWVHVRHDLEGQATFTLKDADGKPVAEVKSVAEQPPFEPNVELTTVDEGEARLYAAIVRPRNFDESLRYPVIVHVYGGPMHQMVTAFGRGYLLDQWMADHGYVVVRIDGRGTPGRGRAWEIAIQGDLIGPPLADQIRGLKALGERIPQLDLGRVGIHGWSFGGTFTAMAVMREGGVFHAGIAGAPVADWADYDTHYTERYLGLPAEHPDAYRASNVLTYAADLTRPLLIMHGTADDNVYFTHALKISDALFRAGKPHDFLPLSGFTHMVPDPVVVRALYGRYMSFFDQHVKRRSPTTP